MKYPREYLEEIKTRLKVSQVVGKSVKLKKRGKEFIGLSPFSNEKTPSFTINDEKGFYHCFSSSEHGNIFDFLMKTKNYKFGEAVRALAADAGMPQYRFNKPLIIILALEKSIESECFCFKDPIILPISLILEAPNDSIISLHIFFCFFFGKLFW